MFRRMCILFGTIAMTGCASTPSTTPAWLDDCGTFWTKQDASRLCAVGSVAPTQSTQLRDLTVRSRAEKQIADQLGAVLRLALPKDRTEKVDEIATAAASQASEATHWTSPEGGYYALFGLDQQAFEASLDGVASLDASERKQVAAAGSAAFSR